MSAVLSLLIRSLATPFYKSHAGVFLFVFFVMFGVVESSQVVFYHQSLIYGMLSTVVFLAVVLGVWFLYQLKVLLYFLKLLNQKEYQVLSHLALLSKSKSFLCFSALNFLTFLPIFIYSIAIYILALHEGFYRQGLLILLVQVFLVAATAFVLTLHVHRRHIPAPFIIPKLSITIFKGQLGIYWSYFLHREKISIALSKLFSIALIYIVKETLTKGDDFRIVAIAWLFAVLSHTFLVMKLKSFEDQRLSWIRNLPIERLRTYLSYFLLYAILFIPESIVLLGTIGRGVTVFQLPLLTLLSSGFLICIHVYLFKIRLNPNSLMNFIFVLFIFCFMMVLSKLILPLILFLLISPAFFFHHYYYQYQAQVDEG